MDTFGILRGFGEGQEKICKSCVIMVSHQYLAQTGLDSPVFLVQPSLFPYSRREKK
jgi:hypothetical protein